MLLPQAALVDATCAFGLHQTFSCLEKARPQATRWLPACLDGKIRLVIQQMGGSRPLGLVHLNLGLVLIPSVLLSPPFVIPSSSKLGS